MGRAVPRNEEWPTAAAPAFPGDELQLPVKKRRPWLRWLRCVAAWDGALPWLVSSAPLILPICLPGVDRIAINFFCVGVFPLAAALARGHLAGLQLQRIFPARLPIGRQVLIALAIIIVFLFEIISCFLHCANNPPLSTWLIPAGLYALYILLTAIALRPPTAARSTLAAEDRWIMM